MANLDVTYYAHNSDEAHELFVYLCCPTCGRPLVEEIGRGGTMFRCRLIGEAGEQPAEDAPEVPTHWWFVHDGT